jgi:hypothetical protein
MHRKGFFWVYLPCNCTTYLHSIIKSIFIIKESKRSVEISFYRPKVSRLRPFWIVDGILFDHDSYASKSTRFCMLYYASNYSSIDRDHYLQMISLSFKTINQYWFLKLSTNLYNAILEQCHLMKTNSNQAVNCTSNTVHSFFDSDEHDGVSYLFYSLFFTQTHHLSFI